MEREQMNWQNELAMLEQNSKDIKSMKYNKGTALRDSKGFNGTALAMGIVEYFLQKNLGLNGYSYMPRYNSLNSIVNRLVNLYGEDVLYDAYTNSPAKLEQLMGQHKIDYRDFAGRVDLHYKNLTKDPKLAEAFLNQDINMRLGYLEQQEQALGKTPAEVVQNVSTRETKGQTPIEKVSDEKMAELSQGMYNSVDEWRKQKIENLVTGVINGWYGTGEERRKALGKDYDEVQRIVNQRLKRERETAKKVQEQPKKEEPKIEPKEEVKREEIKTEPQTYYSNWGGGATVEFQSDPKDDRLDSIKAFEAQEAKINKILEEREKASKEQTTAQPQQVGTQQENTVEQSETKVHNFITVQTYEEYKKQQQQAPGYVHHEKGLSDDLLKWQYQQESKKAEVSQQVKADVPKVEEPKKETVAEPKKEETSITYEQKIEQLARDVLAGKLGSGRERKQALGDLYNTVQARVNQIAIESARGNRLEQQPTKVQQTPRRQENQTLQQPIEEKSARFEPVAPKQEPEKKPNIFKRGWQKLSNGFKKVFGRNKEELLALNPGTAVVEGVKQAVSGKLDFRDSLKVDGITLQEAQKMKDEAMQKQQENERNNGMER